MAGSVYVFNLTPEAISLAVNGVPAADLPGWSGSGNPYQPSAVAVGRTSGGAGPGVFGQSTNMLSMQWLGNPLSAIVAIPNSSPTNRDLVLTLTQNQWQLIEDSGRVIGSGPVSGGFNASAEQEGEEQ